MIKYLISNTSMFLKRKETVRFEAMQMDASLLANNTQHCRAQHVVSMQDHANGCNKCHHAMQMDATCWAQQFCALLANNVAFVCMVLQTNYWSINIGHRVTPGLACKFVIYAPTTRVQCEQCDLFTWPSQPLKILFLFILACR